MNRRYIPAVAALGLLSGILASLLPLKLALISVIGAAYTAVCLVDIRTGILLTIFARSSLDYLGEYGAGFALPGDMRITSLVGVFIVLLMLLLVLSKRISIKSPLTAVFFIFLGIAAIPGLTSGYFMEGLEKWMKFASLASMYIIVYNLVKDDRNYGYRVLDFTAYSSLLPLAAGMVQLVTGSGNKATDGINRLYGTFVHPNPFAFYLIIVIGVCFVGVYAKGARKGTFKLLIASAAIVELLFTYTRGAWAGLALLVVFIFLQLKGRSKYWLILIPVLLAIPFYGLLSSRFKGLFSSRMEDSSLATRFYIWTSMLRYALMSPVIGHGLGTFEYYAQKAIGWKIEAHNEYLRMFFETGICGLIAYLSLTIKAIAAAFASKAGELKILGITVSGMLLSFAVMSLGDNIADNLVSQWYLWSLAAVSSALAVERLHVGRPVAA